MKFNSSTLGRKGHKIPSAGTDLPPASGGPSEARPSQVKSEQSRAEQSRAEQSRETSVRQCLLRPARNHASKAVQWGSLPDWEGVRAKDYEVGQSVPEDAMLAMPGQVRPGQVRHRCLSTITASWIAPSQWLYHVAAWCRVEEGQRSTRGQCDGWPAEARRLATPSLLDAAWVQARGEL